MVEPITAVYREEDGDWEVLVASQDKQLTGRAPGIIAARDRVDQLVEKLSKVEKPTVVHLLNGSALAFTSAYMTARLARPEPTELKVPESTKNAAKKTTRAKSTAKSSPAPRKTRPRAVPDIADDSLAADSAEKPKKAAAESKKVEQDTQPHAASA